MKFNTVKMEMASPTNIQIGMTKNTEFMLNFEINRKGEPAGFTPEEMWLIEDGKFEEPVAMNLINRAGIALTNDTDEDVVAEKNIAYAYANSCFCINAKFWDPKWFQFKLPTDTSGKIYSLGDAAVTALGITYLKLVGENRTTHNYDANYSFFPDGTIVDNNTGKTVDSGIIKFGGDYDNLMIDIYAPVLVPANTAQSAGWRYNFGYVGGAQTQIRPYEMLDKGARKIVADLDTIDATANKDYTLVCEQKQDKFTMPYTFMRKVGSSNYFNYTSQSLSAYAGLEINAENIKIMEGWNGELAPYEPTSWPTGVSGIRVGDGVTAHGVWQLNYYASTGVVWFNNKQTPNTVKTLPIVAEYNLSAAQIANNQYGEGDVFTRVWTTNDGLKFKQPITINVHNDSEGDLEKPIDMDAFDTVKLEGTYTDDTEFSYDILLK